MGQVPESLEGIRHLDYRQIFPVNSWATYPFVNHKATGAMAQGIVQKLVPVNPAAL